MKLLFIQRYFDAGAALGGLIGAGSAFIPGVGPALAAAQGVLGLVQTISGANKSKQLMQQRQAYQTPEEYFKILNATASNAGQGFDPFSLNFMTGQTDRAFTTGLGTATRLGADPNDLSGLFDQKMQGIFKIGAENAQLNMDNFSKYLSALDVIGQNKAAEQKSQQDLIKDQLQAASAEKQSGIQNISNAANAYLGFSSANQAAKLYAQQNGFQNNYPVTSANPVGYVPPMLPDVSTGSSRILVPNRPATGG